jgi:hypothetical protein
MFSQEQLTIEYIADNKRFILGKSELRCIDQKNEANILKVPLNKLDPNYNFYYSFNPIILVFGILLVANGIRGVLGDVLDAAIASHYINSDTRQAALIVLGFFTLNFIAYLLYRSNRRRKALQGYRFVFLGENETAIIIPKLKNDAAKTESFLQALTQRIRKATPSNETILFNLEQYHLLTRVEWAQLDVNILKKPEPETTGQSNIIYFPNKKA